MESESKDEAWSLITIGKKGQETIHIKFVYKSCPSWVWSKDSFEIALDPLIKPKFGSNNNNNNNKNNEPVIAESLYGNYEEALSHLRENLLYTKNPEEIRKGPKALVHLPEEIEVTITRVK